MKKHAIEFQKKTVPAPEKSDPDKRAQLEAVKRWFHDDWRRIEPKLRTSIVEGISVFLSLFDDNPKVKRIFCPPKECYDKEANADGKYGKPLPSFSWLIETGKVCALNFPIGMNPGLAKAIGVMMKLDFERAVLNRVPQIEAHPEQYFRQVFFICDEYQHFATVGENEPTGDEKFFSLSRQPKCIPIIATQSISSLKSSLPGESLAHAFADLPDEDFPGLFRRLFREDCERALREGRPAQNWLQPVRDRPRYPRQFPDGKGSIQQGQPHNVEDLLPAERLSLRYEDVHRAAQRAIGDDCLRRAQSDAADVLLPQALFQRPEQVVFPASSRRGTVNQKKNGVCSRG